MLGSRWTGLIISSVSVWREHSGRRSHFFRKAWNRAERRSHSTIWFFVFSKKLTKGG